MSVQILTGDTTAVNALFDTGANISLVSQALMKRMRLAVGLQSQGVTTINEKPILTYGTVELNVQVTDSEGMVRTQRHAFVCADIGTEDLVLGLDWIRQHTPVVLDWVQSRWRWPVASTAVKIVPPEAFHQELVNGSVAYVVHYETPTQAMHAAATLQRVAGVSLDERPVSELPAYLDAYRDVFSSEAAGVLPKHGKLDHAIDTIDGENPPYGPLYNLSFQELEVLRQYLEESAKKGWIRRSTSPAGAPVLFVPKKDGGLRLCVDYRGLNRITIKNRHALPLISKTQDRLQGSAIYTKLDLKDAYHRIRIKEGDEWKTAFRTRYGHFEYLVMPFGLANAPATFQAYISQALVGLVDMMCVIYLDDILIYSAEKRRHHADVAQVLDRLRQYKLYCNLKKCEFDTDTVEFLGFVVGVDGIKMESSRVESITQWPAPTTFRELQVFIGFANFYHRFIAGFSKVIRPLTDMLKGMKAGKKTGPFPWGDAEAKAFQDLKTRFQGDPILVHFDPDLPIMVETDASGFAIGAVLSQKHQRRTYEAPAPYVERGPRTISLHKRKRERSESPVVPKKGLGTNAGESVEQHEWHPVAFYSRKMTEAETRYDIHDGELLAIVEAFRHWRHYLEGSRWPAVVKTDHHSLQHFMTKKELNRRQARWAEKLAAFDFVIQYRTGKTNPADGPSRRPDYENAFDHAQTLLPTLQRKLGIGAAMAVRGIPTGTVLRTQQDLNSVVQKWRELRDAHSISAPVNRARSTGESQASWDHQTHLDSYQELRYDEASSHRGEEYALSTRRIDKEPTASEKGSSIQGSLEIVVVFGKSPEIHRGPEGAANATAEELHAAGPTAMVKRVNVDLLAQRRILLGLGPALEQSEDWPSSESPVDDFDDEKYEDYWDLLGDAPATPLGATGEATVAAEVAAETSRPPANLRRAAGEAPVTRIHAVAETVDSRVAVETWSEWKLLNVVPRVLATKATAHRSAYDAPGAPLLDLILAAQKADPFVKEERWRLPGTRRRDEGWALRRGGLLERNSKVYIPPDASLRAELLKICHDDPHSGHFGIAKTTAFIQRYYYWPSMLPDIKEYVLTCAVCQRTKATRHRPYGELASLPQPKGPWQEISMDFITDLPRSVSESTAHDSILVVVDRYTKMSLYIPVTKKITAEGLATVFLRRVICVFGVPRGIVSDRGSVFTSHFWSALCYHMKVTRRLSTAFHPQSDGQTERQNQALEHYLRCYCNYRQNDWVSKLPLAEFTYNNSRHSTIGCTPFYALYGYDPVIIIHADSEAPVPTPEAALRAKRLREEREELTKRWGHAV